MNHSIHELTAVRIRFNEARVKWLPVHYLFWGDAMNLGKKTDEEREQEFKKFTRTGYLIELQDGFYIAPTRYNKKRLVGVNLDGTTNFKRTAAGARVLCWWFIGEDTPIQKLP